MNALEGTGLGPATMVEVCNRRRRAMPVTRRRALRSALLAAGVGALLSAVAPAAGAAATPAAPVTSGSEYLALGDSVTFGYEEPQVVPAPNYSDASSFIGYPEQLGAELHLKVANASCPGETSASLVNASAPSNGCESGYRAVFPLHVRYKGSQLAYAIRYLQSHPGVHLVSLMIGANDFFICERTTADGCTSSSELAATAAEIEHNVHVILKSIRTTAQYHGQLAIVSYYSLNYASAVDNGVSALLNNAMDTAAKPFGVELADGFSELQAAASHSGGDTCAAGLLTQLGSPGSCGIHPSFAGQALLAQALEEAIRL
jgi:lysophospholipase L1-like esterase